MVLSDGMDSLTKKSLGVSPVVQRDLQGRHIEKVQRRRLGEVVARPTTQPVVLALADSLAATACE